MAVQGAWGIAGSIRAVKGASAIATYEAAPCKGFEAATRFSYGSEWHDCRQTEKSPIPQRARRLSAENFSTRRRPPAEGRCSAGTPRAKFCFVRGRLALDYAFGEAPFTLKLPVKMFSRFENQPVPHRTDAPLVRNSTNDRPAFSACRRVLAAHQVA